MSRRVPPRGAPREKTAGIAASVPIEIRRTVGRKREAHVVGLRSPGLVREGTCSGVTPGIDRLRSVGVARVVAVHRVDELRRLLRKSVLRRGPELLGRGIRRRNLDIGAAASQVSLTEKGETAEDNDVKHTFAYGHGSLPRKSRVSSAWLERKDSH
jgi:hypothetical protein